MNSYVVGINAAEGLSVEQLKAQATGNLATAGGGLLALSELAPGMVDVTATGMAYNGAGEYAGYVCTVAAGNITVYDNNAAASGRVLVPTQALVLGPMPWMGAGTNHRAPLSSGLWIVLSNASARVTAIVGP